MAAENVTPHKFNCCLICGELKISIRFTSKTGLERDLLTIFTRYLGISDVNYGGLCYACDKKLTTIQTKCAALKEQCERTMASCVSKRMAKSPKQQAADSVDLSHQRKRQLFVGGKFLNKNVS